MTRTPAARDTLALRLGPGGDLRDALEALTLERGIAAGFGMTAAGNPSRASLRCAGKRAATTGRGDPEIAALAAYPVLNGRPIAVASPPAVIGRPPEKVLDIP